MFRSHCNQNKKIKQVLQLMFTLITLTITNQNNQPTEMESITQKQISQSLNHHLS